MRAIANVLGLLSAVGLAACASTADLPAAGLFGGSGGEPKPDAAATTQGIEVPNGPPVPDRNERIRKAQAAGPGKGEAKQAGLSLPRLSDVKLFGPGGAAPDSVEWGQAPVQVYAQLAQQVRACWFTPGAPKLQNYGFFATVADGEANEATIIIYQKDPSGGRGAQAYRILITGNSSASTVRAENRHLDSKLDQTFKTDIARWAAGKQECGA